MASQHSTPTRRLRRDPRKEATRTAIIEAAESLFAERGIDGVSLRQIGAAIGSANTSVVAYHFGSKEALVEAIFHHRLPAIDARRGELLAEVGRTGGETEVLSLLRALWLPLYEQVDDECRHSYAGFLSALIRSDWGGSRIAVSDRYGAANELAQRLVAALPAELKPLFEARLNLSAVMITGALQLMDREHTTAGGKKRRGRKPADDPFDDTLRMTCAALLAPTGK